MTRLTAFLPAIRYRTPPAVEQLDAALLLSDILGLHGAQRASASTGPRRRRGDRRGRVGGVRARDPRHRQVLQLRGRLVEAEAEHRIALDELRGRGDRGAEAATLEALGWTLRQQGRMDEAQTLSEQALAIHREVGNRLPEAIVLGSLTRWHILGCDDLAAAEALAVRAGALLLQFGDTDQMAELVSMRGHIALARGLDPTEQITRARQLAVDLKAEPDSELGKVCARLDRACAAFRAGQPLICGHAPEDITPGQMRWLREHRPHVLPPALMARLSEDGTLRQLEQGDEPQGVGRRLPHGSAVASPTSTNGAQ